MNCVEDAAPFGDLSPGALLKAVARELRGRGLEVREYNHGYELVEIAIANPGNAAYSRATVGYDGRVTWEYRGDLETPDGAREITNLVAVLLKSDPTAPMERADDDKVG